MTYKKDHTGDLNIDHKAKHSDTKKLEEEHKYKNIADNDIDTNIEESIVTDYTKKVVVDVKGDIAYKSNNATRGYSDYSLTGVAGMNWEIEELEINAQELMSTVKDYENVSEKSTTVGNTHLNVGSVNFGNGSEKGEVSELESVDGIIRDLTADALAGVAGKYRDEDNTPGLKHLYANLRWKKLLSEDSVDKESIKILSCISSSLRGDLLDRIVDIYTTTDLVESKSLEIPDGITKWSDFLKKGYAAKKSSMESAKQLKEKERDHYKNLLVSEALINDKGTVQRWKTSKAKLINEIKELKTEIEGLPAKEALDIENLKDRIEQDLKLRAQEYTRPGYLYVFIKSSDYKDENGNIPYTQTSLYKEYKITSQDEKPIYNEIEFNHKTIGLDTRTSKEKQVTCPSIPAVYIDDGLQQHEVETRLLFSEVQLSWAKLAKFAGIDKTDERADGCDNANFDECTRASEIESYRSCIKKGNLQKFYNFDLPSARRSYYQNEQNKEPLTVSDLKVEDLYFKAVGNSSYALNVLVEDPLGIVLQYSLTVAYLRTKLNTIVEQVDKDNKMKSALMTY